MQISERLYLMIHRAGRHSYTAQITHGLGRQHSAAGQVTPLHCQRRKSHSAAMMSKEVEEMISGDVVGLPLGPPDRHHRRETDEKVELQVPGQLLQHPRAKYLGAEHHLDFIDLQSVDGLISGNTGGMNNSTYRGPGCPERFKDLEHLSFICHVDGGDENPDSFGLKPAHALLRGAGNSASTPQQREVPRSLLRQPASCPHAERPQTAGDQIRGVRAYRDVPALRFGTARQTSHITRSIPMSNLVLPVRVSDFRE